MSVPSGSQLSTSLASLAVTAIDGSFGKFWQICLPVSRREALSLALVHLQVLPTFLGRTASLKAF